jgi:hypothetical protein
MVLCLNGWTTKPLPWPLCQLCQIYFQLRLPAFYSSSKFCYCPVRSVCRCGTSTASTGSKSSSISISLTRILMGRPSTCCEAVESYTSEAKRRAVRCEVVEWKRFRVEPQNLAAYGPVDGLCRVTWLKPALFRARRRTVRCKAAKRRDIRERRRTVRCKAAKRRGFRAGRLRGSPSLAATTAVLNRLTANRIFFWYVFTVSLHTPLQTQPRKRSN